MAKPRLGTRTTKSAGASAIIGIVKQGNFLCHFIGGPLDDKYIEMEEKSHFHIMECEISGTSKPCYYRLIRDSNERGRVDRTNDIVKKTKPDLEFMFHHYCEETEVSVKVYRDSEAERKRTS